MNPTTFQHNPSVQYYAGDELKTEKKEEKIQEFNLELPFLYDLFYSDEFHGSLDLNFYLKEVEKLGNSIFELGIGTGRIAIELAKIGKMVEGVDISANNLHCLEKKLEDYSSDIKTKIKVHLCDILKFETEKKYDVILFSFRCAQHFQDINSQIALFTWAKNHLYKGGKIIFDVFYPNLEVFKFGLKNEVFHFKAISNGKLIEKWFIKDSYNESLQTFAGYWLYKFYDNAHKKNLEKVVQEKFSMHYYTYIQIKLLTKLCGLKIESEYGSFDKKSKIGEGPEMIFTLSKEDEGIDLLNTAQKV